MHQRNVVEQFIAFARTDAGAMAKLSDCQITDWGDGHLPLDIDLAKVIAVAEEYGFQLSFNDIIHTQCNKLSEFWQFEMENSFVARRSMAIIQYQIEGELPISYDY